MSHYLQVVNECNSINNSLKSVDFNPDTEEFKKARTTLVDIIFNVEPEEEFLDPNFRYKSNSILGEKLVEQFISILLINSKHYKARKLGHAEISHPILVALEAKKRGFGIKSVLNAITHDVPENIVEAEFKKQKNNRYFDTRKFQNEVLKNYLIDLNMRLNSDYVIKSNLSSDELDYLVYTSGIMQTKLVRDFTASNYLRDMMHIFFDRKGKLLKNYKSNVLYALDLAQPYKFLKDLSNVERSIPYISDEVAGIKYSDRLENTKRFDPDSDNDPNKQLFEHICINKEITIADIARLAELKNLDPQSYEATLNQLKHVQELNKELHKGKLFWGLDAAAKIKHLTKDHYLNEVFRAFRKDKRRYSEKDIALEMMMLQKLTSADMELSKVAADASRQQINHLISYHVPLDYAIDKIEQSEEHKIANWYSMYTKDGIFKRYCEPLIWKDEKVVYEVSKSENCYNLQFKIMFRLYVLAEMFNNDSDFYVKKGITEKGFDFKSQRSGKWMDVLRWKLS